MLYFLSETNKYVKQVSPFFQLKSNRQKFKQYIFFQNFSSQHYKVYYQNIKYLAEICKHNLNEIQTRNLKIFYLIFNILFSNKIRMNGKSLKSSILYFPQIFYIIISFVDAFSISKELFPSSL